MLYSRRKFIRTAAIIGSSIPLHSSCFNILANNYGTHKLEVNIFSKHLQFLDLKSAGEIAAELGFDGLDLTVRPKGHILPERVTTDLPNAINDIKSSGSTCKMITTTIQDISNPNDRELIKVASKLGIQYYRSNWFKYQKDRSMVESLEYYQKKIKELGEFNKQHSIVGCYQNHAGKGVGSSYWEIHKLLETVDPKYFGTQYDIRHATLEGGYSWENGLTLLKDSIKTIVLKDFKWKPVNGKWKAVNVPIGEGMVDFNSYFKLLKSYGLAPPASLHMEYQLGGAEHGHESITVDKKIVFDAMKKDLNTIQQLWKSAI